MESNKTLRYPVLAEYFFPAMGIFSDICFAVFGSVFIGLCAQIEFPLFPVPITGQTFGVLLIGLAFGRNLGAVTLLAYLFEGAMGLPFFSGGAGGIPPLAGPTGGYLIGMVFAAYVVGFLAEKGWDRRFDTTVLAMLAGNAVIYAFGLPWLARFVSANKVFEVGFFPFLIGDLLKLAMVALVLPLGWQVLQRIKK